MVTESHLAKRCRLPAELSGPTGFVAEFVRFNTNGLIAVMLSVIVHGFADVPAVPVLVVLIDPGPDCTVIMVFDHAAPLASRANPRLATLKVKDSVFIDSPLELAGATYQRTSVRYVARRRQEAFFGKLH